MEKKIEFGVEHGLFNTKYKFVIKQEKRETKNCYGKTEAIVTMADVYNNGVYVTGATVTKHYNDKDQDKIAFYRALDKLAFKQFPIKNMRAKIFEAFKTSFEAYSKKEQETVC